MFAVGCAAGVAAVAGVGERVGGVAERAYWNYVRVVVERC